MTINEKEKKLLLKSMTFMYSDNGNLYFINNKLIFISSEWEFEFEISEINFEFLNDVVNVTFAYDKDFGPNNIYNDKIFCSTMIKGDNVILGIQFSFNDNEYKLIVPKNKNSFRRNFSTGHCVNKKAFKKSFNLLERKNIKSIILTKINHLENEIILKNKLKILLSNPDNKIKFDDRFNNLFKVLNFEDFRKTKNNNNSKLFINKLFGINKHLF